MEGFAKMVSIAIQYGTPLQEIIDSYKNTIFEPNGITTDPEIRSCSSVFDYIVRRIEIDYLEGKGAGGPGLRGNVGSDGLDSRQPGGLPHLGDAMAVDGDDDRG